MGQGAGCRKRAMVRFLLWKSREEVAGHWQLDRRFEPSMSRDEAGEKMKRWREAVARSRGWATP